jgi:hypothetical protein
LQFNEIKFFANSDFFVAMAKKINLLCSTMTDHPHPPMPGTSTSPVRGGLSDLYQSESRADGVPRTPSRPASTNRRAWQHLGVEKGELSLCRKAEFFVGGNHNLQLRKGWLRKTNVNNNKKTDTARRPFKQSWATQRVDFKIQIKVPSRNPLDFDQERNLNSNNEIRSFYCEDCFVLREAQMNSTNDQPVSSNQFLERMSCN